MAGDIEFLPEEPGADEPLANPHRPSGRRWPARRGVRVAAVVMVATAAIAWVLTRPGAGNAPSAAATGIVPTHTVPTHTVHAHRHSRPVASFAPDAMITCGLGTPVADEVTAAMHRYLSGIVVDNLNSYRCVRTVRAFDRIVFEAVRGHYRNLDVVVELTARTARGEVPLPEFHESDLGGARLPALRTIQTEGAALIVRIAVSGPHTARIPDGPMATSLTGLADYLTLNIYL